MTAMDFEQRLTVLRDRVAFDPDAVPCQQIEGMVRGAIGRPHTVVVIGNLPLERVHDGGFDLLSSQQNCSPHSGTNTSAVSLISTRS